MNICGRVNTTPEEKEARAQHLATIRPPRCSRESTALFMPLAEWAKKNWPALSMCFGQGTELCVHFADGKRYWPDFAEESLKLAIEYQGIAFHPDPRWKETAPARWNGWKCVYSNASAAAVHAMDQLKKQHFTDDSWSYLEVWSNDRRAENFLKCAAFIEKVAVAAGLPAATVTFSAEENVSDDEV